MTTIHLGVEEMIARQQPEAVERSVRHAWHWTELRRSMRRQPQAKARTQTPQWVNELVVFSTTQARWAMM